MDNPIVKVEGLSHRYATQWAIKDISFEIDRKGVVGLLGANGAGKSTTMNIMCGVLKQRSGKVWIDGIDLRAQPVEAKKHIGFMPQKLPLHPDFTVKEYLTYAANLRMQDKTQIARAVEEAASRCGVAHFSRRMLRNLSGGYQQRVGIAQAIVHNPKFVVLDEPTNGLDPNQIIEVRHLIQEIADERAVLLSTHILSEVKATCQQIKMIDQGELVFSGSLDEFDNYIEPNALVVTLDQPPSDASALKIDGIRNVLPQHGHTYRLEYDGEKRTVKRLSDHCVHQGWGLLELSVEKSSMDTVFAKLSKSK